jgi:hypothetical protein
VTAPLVRKRQRGQFGAESVANISVPAAYRFGQG